MGIKQKKKAALPRKETQNKKTARIQTKAGVLRRREESVRMKCVRKALEINDEESNEGTSIRLDLV